MKSEDVLKYMQTLLSHSLPVHEADRKLAELEARFQARWRGTAERSEDVAEKKTPAKSRNSTP
jgi:hypothetical protein